MNRSTDGVTLYSGFVFDLLSAFENNRATFAAPLFAMAMHLEEDQPTQLSARVLLFPSRVLPVVCGEARGHVRSLAAGGSRRVCGSLSLDLHGSEAPAAVLPPSPRAARCALSCGLARPSTSSSPKPPVTTCAPAWSLPSTPRLRTCAGIRISTRSFQAEAGIRGLDGTR